jgi:hypothetical protein
MEKTTIAVRRFEGNGATDQGRPRGWLHPLWRRVKGFARKVGDFQARVILSLLYLVIIGPHALVVRIFTDPLRLRAERLPEWLIRHRPVARRLAQARRQF